MNSILHEVALLLHRIDIYKLIGVSSMGSGTRCLILLAVIVALVIFFGITMDLWTDDFNDNGQRDSQRVAYCKGKCCAELNSAGQCTVEETSWCTLNEVLTLNKKIGSVDHTNHCKLSTGTLRTGEERVYTWKKVDYLQVDVNGRFRAPFGIGET